MTLALRSLKSLAPGDRFLCPLSGKKGTLLYITACSAMVSFGNTRKEIRTTVVKDGQEVEKVAAFEKADRVSISRETQVVRLVLKKKGA